MKPEKMTPERLDQITASYESATTPEAFVVRELLAYLAAVEAERDAVAKALDALGVPTEADEHGSGRACDLAGRVRLLGNARDNLTTERDALRERGRALEAQLHDDQSDARTLEAEVMTLQRTLAAIRQRAGDKEALERVAWDATNSVDPKAWTVGDTVVEVVAPAVAAYILGPDAKGVPVDGEFAGTPNPDGDRDEPSDRTQPAPEPSTAEAFATVLKALGFRASTTEVQAARAALSLLERRMGAVGRAGQMLLAADTLAGLADAKDAMRAALTDAPRVYSEEEVEAMEKRLRDEVPNPGAEYLDGWLDALDTFRQSLAALRKGT